MKKIRIVVLAGGWSGERDVSLTGGEAVFQALDPEKYHVMRLDPMTEFHKIYDGTKDIDLAFILLHGKNGEDGKIQGVLDILNIPYTGSGVLASAMAANKKIAKDIYRRRNLPVVDDLVLKKDFRFEYNDIKRLVGEKLVVKPLEEGSSLGVSVCHDEESFRFGVSKAFEHGGEVLVEEYIQGREISCCVLGNERAEVLPVIEIIPDKRFVFFDYEAKYKPGASREVCPADLSPDLEITAKKYALAAHEALGCRTWSRTDMIIKEERIYLLETNTIPGMTKTSLFPLAAKAIGISFAELVERLVSLSLNQ